VICLAVFVGVVYLTRYVSVGSIVAALSLPIVLALMQVWFQQDIPDALFEFSILVSILIIFTHRKNIRRLIEGTENRFGKPRTAA
jgi:glycerol-3-phosphate acyltransferase PlsY